MSHLLRRKLIKIIMTTKAVVDAHWSCVVVVVVTGDITQHVVVASFNLNDNDKDSLLLMILFPTISSTSFNMF